MSGIARNTLRLIGAAKYPRTMKLTTNGLNNSLALLQPQYFNHNVFIQAESMSVVYKKTYFVDHSHIISSLLPSKPPISIKKEGKVTKAKTGLLKASLSCGTVKLTTAQEIRRLILHPTFNIKLNGESIEPESDKTTDPDEKASFKLDKWHVSRDGDKLILRVRGSDETFILKHAVNIIAHEKPFIHGENGDFNVTSGKIISDVSSTNAKLLSKSDSSEILERSFEPLSRTLLLKRLLIPDKITDGPNRQSKMELKFPMTASLEGAQQVIKMEDSDDYCTVNHTIDVQAYKLTLPENGNNKVKEVEEEEKGNILRMELESGDLIIESIAPGYQRVIIQQDAGIEINLDSEVPFIRIVPSIKIQESLYLK